MRAVLKKPALLSILCATVETFKKESFGILVGNKNNKQINIEQAVPLQSAKRLFTEIEANDKRHKTVLRTVNLMWNQLKPIGDFHSHTEREAKNYKSSRYPVNPSEHDTGTSKKDEIYLIVGISFKKKSQKWQRDRKYSIIGTLGNYRFEIRAYFAPENKKLEQIPLICPSAYQLNAFKK